MDLDWSALWLSLKVAGWATAINLVLGVALGAFIEGFKVVERNYAGGSLDWLTPFSLFCGVGLIVAYALLGCTWLIMKTEGRLQERMHDLARPLALVLLGVSSWLSDEGQEWFQAIMSLTACALVVQMVVWMKKHGRTLKGELEGGARASIANDNWWGLFVLVAIAVVGTRGVWDGLAGLVSPVPPARSAAASGRETSTSSSPR